MSSTMSGPARRAVMTHEQVPPTHGGAKEPALRIVDVKQLAQSFSTPGRLAAFLARREAAVEFLSVETR